MSLFRKTLDYLRNLLSTDDDSSAYPALRALGIGEVFERVVCELEGDVLYTYVSESGLRSRILYTGSDYLYCVNEPPYMDRDIARVIGRLWTKLSEDGHLSLTHDNAFRPKTLEEYLEAKVATGLGKIYPILLDPEVEDVALNRPGTHVMVNHRVLGIWMRTNIVIGEPEATRLSSAISSLIQRPLSVATPLAEGISRLGLRMAVTLGDSVSPGGTSFVIRRIPMRPLSVPELIADGFISPYEAAYLWSLLERRGFIVILGGMATGKTTLLQALLDLLPSYMRIITIEDTPEIRLMHPNWDSLALHRGFFIGGGSPHYTLFDIAKYALRRRADFLVIGEVRGEEARVLFQAAMTGHGSLCLPPDEMLVVRDGPKAKEVKISEVIRMLTRGKDVAVLSLTESGNLVWIRPSRWILTLSRRWVRLILENGISVVLTPDHIVPVARGGDVIFKRAEEVITGDSLLRVRDPISSAPSAQGSVEARPILVRVKARQFSEGLSLACDLTLSKEARLIVHSSGVVTHNCSFHAENVETAVARLSSPPISVPRSSLRNIWAFVTLGFRGGSRKVTSLAETDPHSSSLRYTWLNFHAVDGDPLRSIVDGSLRLRALASDMGLSMEELIDELASKVELLHSLARRRVSSRELRKYVDSFYLVTSSKWIKERIRRPLSYSEERVLGYR